jgi:predicted small lipoprotein YifL
MCRAVVVLAALAACGQYVPPAPAAPRSGTTVNAPFAKTWEATVDVFAERNIQIKTIDRASGIIAAEPQSLTTIAADSLADCGHSSTGGALQDRMARTESATWNVLVRGDSTKATVKATVRFAFVSGLNGQTYECSSTGRWEKALEQRVKSAAESKVGG